MSSAGRPYYSRIYTKTKPSKLSNISIFVCVNKETEKWFYHWWTSTLISRIWSLTIIFWKRHTERHAESIVGMFWIWSKSFFKFKSKIFFFTIYIVNVVNIQNQRHVNQPIFVILVCRYNAFVYRSTRGVTICSVPHSRVVCTIKWRHWVAKLH